MPTYEFRCPKGHDFERFYRSIGTAQSEASCPDCGAPATRRMSAGGGLVFKGSGFYITDYGKDGKKSQAPAAAAKSESAKSDGPAVTDSAKSDSAKPEKKPAPAKPAGE